MALTVSYDYSVASVRNERGSSVYRAMDKDSGVEVIVYWNGPREFSWEVLRYGNPLAASGDRYQTHASTKKAAIAAALKEV